MTNHVVYIGTAEQAPVQAPAQPTPEVIRAIHGVETLTKAVAAHTERRSAAGR